MNSTKCTPTDRRRGLVPGNLLIAGSNACCITVRSLFVIFAFFVANKK